MPPVPTADHFSPRSEEEVALFKSFLRINTVHPNPDIKGCVAWLKQQGEAIGLKCQVWHHVEALPILIMSLVGTEPSLPAIGLNCHMDVVPVELAKWDKLPEGETPFSAWEDPKTGLIYARGSQDMKCVGAQYLCALKRLLTAHANGRPLQGLESPFRRTIHTVWVPDEEINGANGMGQFVQSPMFRGLNLACMLDEGLAHEDNKFVVYYGERATAWVKLSAVGPVGHGSKLIPNTAFDRINKAAARLTAMRDANVQRLIDDPRLKLGDVTTINITAINGGTTNDGGKTFAPDVIPANAFLLADIRIALQDTEAVWSELNALVRDFDLKLDMLTDGKGAPHSDTQNAIMRALCDSIGQWGAAVEPAVFPAATDSRYVRRAGVNAYGFSPLRLMPSLLHDHNEALSRAGYIEGVDVYEHLIPALANLPAGGKL